MSGPAPQQEGIKPTKEQLTAGVAGFDDYATMYCKGVVTCIGAVTTDLHAMAEEAARELFSGYQNEIAVAIIERALIGGLREAADESGYGAQFEEAAAAIERLTARVKELEAGRAMTGLKIDRSEAVNLARDWLDSQAPKGGMHITNKGLKLSRRRS